MFPATPGLHEAVLANVGDMLERLTRRRYISALHRVRSSPERDRLSMALFFDPSFDAFLAAIAGVEPKADRPHTQVRWHDFDPHIAHGTSGEYLLSKVGRVFPELRETAIRS